MSIISIHVFFLESLFIYVVKRVHKVSSYENEALTACQQFYEENNNTNNDITLYLERLTYSVVSCLALRLVQKGGEGNGIHIISTW